MRPSPMMSPSSSFSAPDPGSGRRPADAARREATAAGRRGLCVVCAALLLAGAAGCRTVRMTPLARDDLGKGKSVLVLPLDERHIAYAAADFTLYGKTGAQGSGAPVARAVARAFGDSGLYRPVPRARVHAAMHSRKLKLADLGELPPARAVEFAQAVKAEIVVVGAIGAYQTSWVLFIPRSRIAFTLAGYETAGGGELWRAECRDRATFRRESALTRRAARDLARLLKDARTSDR